jgi:hypothetical protein
MNRSENGSIWRASFTAPAPGKSVTPINSLPSNPAELPWLFVGLPPLVPRKRIASSHSAEQRERE